MVAKTSRSHDALQQLLEERKRYEQWIATLESRRESTPEHVYKRVHADYEQRLAAVRDQLTERTGEIRAAITGLKDRLRETTEQETARVDELHEAELRAVVGEFTPEQWELRKREVEVELKQFVDEKKKISDELNQLLLIMEQTTVDDAPASRSGRSDAAPPSASAPKSDDSVPVFTPAPDAPAPQPPPIATPADATRVRSKTPSRSRAALHADPARAPSDEAKVPIESLAPADGLPAKVETAPPVAPAPPEASPAPAPAAEKAEPRPAAHAKRGKTSGFAHVPADSRRENEKTLKCAECGAMNYPTEWYCESCGGELSAL